jgi:D-lactate dehydrogenase
MDYLVLKFMKKLWVLSERVQLDQRLVNIMKGFGAKVICYDLYENPECLAAGATYVSLEELLSQSDIISLHSPLTRSTYHMIDAKAVAAMKKGVHDY